MLSEQTLQMKFHLHVNATISSGFSHCLQKYQFMGFQSTKGYRIRQSELPRPIPRNSVESDYGCASRIYFDNAGDDVTPTLYNVTLTSQKPC